MPSSRLVSRLRRHAFASPKIVRAEILQPRYLLAWLDLFRQESELHGWSSVAQRCWTAMDYIGENIGMLPVRPERPSERAMRIAESRRKSPKEVIK